MARLAIAAGTSVLGGILGGIAGGPAGAILGAQIGAGVGEAAGALFLRRPPLAQLQSLNVSSAADGAPIPFGYGTCRFPGQIIWSPGLTFKQVKEATGHGAPGGYAYYCSFAVAFGEGPGNIRRIWGDSKLIFLASGASFNMQALGSYGVYSATTQYEPGDLVLYLTPGATGVGSQLVWECVFPTKGNAPSTSSIYWQLASEYPPWDDTATYQIGSIVGYFTQVYAAIAPTQGDHPNVSPTKWIPLAQYYGTPNMYPGDELQNPDPLIQASLGVGRTPAHRGLIYAVAENFPLANFGNRVPNLRAEIEFTGVS